MESLAHGAGIRPHELLALVGAGAPGAATITLRTTAGAWSREFSEEELSRAGGAVTAFLTEAVAQIAEATRAAYQSLMSQYKV